MYSFQKIGINCFGNDLIVNCLGTVATSVKGLIYSGPCNALQWAVESCYKVVCTFSKD